MHAFSSILALSALAALVSANGTIDLYSSSGCSGSSASGSYVPPANCNGGCVQYSAKSAKEGPVDNGYIFTVYTDTSCSSGKKAVRGCVSGNWKSFSYDCGS